jgi:hypothetical protein
VTGPNHRRDLSRSVIAPARGVVDPFGEPSAARVAAVAIALGIVFIIGAHGSDAAGQVLGSEPRALIRKVREVQMPDGRGVGEVAVLSGAAGILAVPSPPEGPRFAAGFPRDYPDELCYVFDARGNYSKKWNGIAQRTFCQIVAAADGRTLGALTLQEPKNAITHQAEPFSVVSCFSPSDGRLLGTGNTRPRSTTGGISSIAFAPSGRHLFCEAAGISVFSAPRLDVREEFEESEERDVAAFSSDGRRAALCRNSGVCLVEMRAGAAYRQIPVDGLACNLCFSSDGKLLGFVRLKEEECTTEVWDADRGVRIAQFGRPDTCVYMFLPNSDVLLAWADKQMGLFGATTGIKLCAFGPPPQRHDCAAFCDQGRFLVSGHGGNVTLWEVDRTQLGRPKRAADRSAPHAPPASAELFSRNWDLLRGDAPTAAEASVFFASQGDHAVAFLEPRLAAAKTDSAEVERLVGELDSDAYATRRRAEARLTLLAPMLWKELHRQLDAAQSAEVRRSLQRIVVRADGYLIKDQECLQTIRAIQCLERIGSRRAIGLLERLAAGEPFAPTTEDAQFAIGRLKNWVSAAGVETDTIRRDHP